MSFFVPYYVYYTYVLHTAHHSERTVMTNRGVLSHKGLRTNCTREPILVQYVSLQTLTRNVYLCNRYSDTLTLYRLQSTVSQSNLCEEKVSRVRIETDAFLVSVFVHMARYQNFTYNTLWLDENKLTVERWGAWDFDNPEERFIIAERKIRYSFSKWAVVRGTFSTWDIRQ